MKLPLEFVFIGDAVVDGLSFTVGVQYKGSWCGQHTPFAGDFWLFCRVDLYYLNLIGQIINEAGQRGLLLHLARDATRCREIDNRRDVALKTAKYRIIGAFE